MAPCSGSIQAAHIFAGCQRLRQAKAEHRVQAAPVGAPSQPTTPGSQSMSAVNDGSHLLPLPPQEEAKKKARAERFNLPKSKAELEKEAKEKAAALAAELAEKKRQRGERFGTMSEVCSWRGHAQECPAKVFHSVSVCCCGSWVARRVNMGSALAPCPMCPHDLSDVVHSFTLVSFNGHSVT